MSLRRPSSPCLYVYAMKGHMVRSTIVLSVYFQFQFTIPSGYPPADVRIRNWLLSRRHYNQEETAEWLRGFLYALLRVTLFLFKLYGNLLYLHSFHKRRSLPTAD